MGGQCGWEDRFLELLGGDLVLLLLDPPLFVRKSHIGIEGMGVAEFLTAEENGSLPPRGEGWDIANLVPPPERAVRERVAKIIRDAGKIKRSALLRKVQHFLKADGLNRVLLWMWADGDIDLCLDYQGYRPQGCDAEVYKWLGGAESPTVLDETDEKTDDGDHEAT